MLQSMPILISHAAHPCSARRMLSCCNEIHPPPSAPVAHDSEESLRPFFDPLGSLAASIWLPTHDLPSTQQTRKMGCIDRPISRRRVSFPPKPRVRRRQARREDVQNIFICYHWPSTSGVMLVPVTAPKSSILCWKMLEDAGFGP